MMKIVSISCKLLTAVECDGSYILKYLNVSIGMSCVKTCYFQINMLFSDCFQSGILFNLYYIFVDSNASYLISE